MKKSKKSKITEIYNELCLSYKNKYKEPEEWKPVIYKGCTSRYVISNYGRIFNIDKIKYPSVYINNKHFVTDIKLDSGERIRIGTYRLVALMFIPIPEEYLNAGYNENTLVVDHKRDGDDDNFDDNTVWNLQWLTSRENTAKASKCGYRPYYHINFRGDLDKLILEDYDNNYIYKYIKEKYGYDKLDIKATLQVRRRRLNKTLKEHHERDKKFVEQVDKLLIAGLSNDEIIDKLSMPLEGRSSARLLQYRRFILNIPANKSRYLDNERNDELNKLIEAGYKTKEIINHFDLNLSNDDLNKFKSSIRTRIAMYRKSIQKGENNN